MALSKQAETHITATSALPLSVWSRRLHKASMDTFNGKKLCITGDVHHPRPVKSLHDLTAGSYTDQTDFQ